MHRNRRRPQRSPAYRPNKGNKGYKHITVEERVKTLISKYNEVITTTSPDKNIEFEMRLRDVSRKMYEKIINRVRESPNWEAVDGVQCTINTMSPYNIATIVNKGGRSHRDSKIVKPWNIVTMVFNGTKRVETKYSRKTPITSVTVRGGSSIPDYRIGVSIEQDINETSPVEDAVVRLRIRVTYVEKESDDETCASRPRWKADITAVREGKLNSIGNMLPTLRNKLFQYKDKPLTIDTLFQAVDDTEITRYEVEIENINPNANIQVDDVLLPSTLTDMNAASPNKGHKRNIVTRLFDLIVPNYISAMQYHNDIYYVACKVVERRDSLWRYKQEYGLKRLSNQVKVISKSDYYKEIYPPYGYYATEKADGLRSIILIRNNVCHILTDTVKAFYPPDGDKTYENIVLIADAELIHHNLLTNKYKDGSGDPNLFNLYLFDCMELLDEGGYAGQMSERDNTKHELSIMARQGFEERVKHLAVSSEIINHFISSKGHTAHAKNFTRLDQVNIQDTLTNIVEKEYDYEIDGLILTKPGSSYIRTNNYKWKPADRITIDFLAVKVTGKLLEETEKKLAPESRGIKGHTLHFLFVGASSIMRDRLKLEHRVWWSKMFPGMSVSSPYQPTLFTPSIAPYAYLYWHDDSHGDVDRQIVELRLAEGYIGGSVSDIDGNNIVTNDWRFIKLRDDRKKEKGYYGNDFRVAEITYSNYIDPFPIEAMWIKDTGYFTKMASTMYSSSNRFKRFVITRNIHKYLSNVRWAIDLAAGRGGDLHRYQQSGVKNALFIDKDSTALVELINRKFSFKAWGPRRTVEEHDPDWKHGNQRKNHVQQKRYHTLAVTAQMQNRAAQQPTSTKIYVMAEDLTNPHKKIIDKMSKYNVTEGEVDAMVCNFAIHYMCESVASMRNLLMLVSKMLKTYGVFMFTTMDGAAVFELLKDLKYGEEWVVKQDDVRKYAIKKLYKGKELTPAGQKISVLLPLSNEMYEEPLANIDHIIVEADKLGLDVIVNESFSEYSDLFARANQQDHIALTQDDKDYIALHRCVILRKR